jgi:hypothetical protein
VAHRASRKAHRSPLKYQRDAAWRPVSIDDLRIRFLRLADAA